MPFKSTKASSDSAASADAAVTMKVEDADSLAIPGRPAEGEADDSSSQHSSEIDDKKANSSPSKRAATKSKRGTRASNGKAAKALQENVDGDRISVESTTPVTADVVPSTEITSAENVDEGTDVNDASTNSNGSKETSRSTHAEQDTSAAPRRSRRGPGASPEPNLKDEAVLAEASDDKGRVQQAQGDRMPQTAATLDIEHSHAQEAEMEFDDNPDAGDGGDEGVTRCVCGSSDENIGLMIQCETCKCWQHCVCMGMQVEEDCPDVYFCEQCRPELHIPLLRSLNLLPKPSKKGSSKGIKYTAKELDDAREAIALLSEENARRAQAAETAASYGSRERKSSANPRSERGDKNEIQKSPKRRSTMNSRDSAYSGWQPLPPGLLADGENWNGTEANPHEDRKSGRKRKRGGPDDEEGESQDSPEPNEDPQDPNDLNKRRRISNGLVGKHEEDFDTTTDRVANEPEDATADLSVPVRDKVRKKKGNNQYTVRESSVTAESAKPRHPNQYTYRNKGKVVVVPGNSSKVGSGSASNPTSHSHSPSPSPSKSRTESSRRGATRDSHAGTPTPGDAGGRHTTSIPQLGLPEHLAHLSYLLPLANQRQIPSAAKVLVGAAAASAAAKKQASASASTPAAPTFAIAAAAPSPFRTVASIESSTKVRFPGRRMTLGEMRKRVRNIGEYVTRSQIEAVERERRMKMLGINSPTTNESEEETIPPAAPDAAHETAPDEVAATEDVETEASEPKAVDDNRPKAAHDTLPMSMRLMEELTRELINFQKRFGTAPGSNGGLNTTYPTAIVK